MELRLRKQGGGEYNLMYLDTTNLFYRIFIGFYSQENYVSLKSSNMVLIQVTKIFHK